MKRILTIALALVALAAAGVALAGAVVVRVTPSGFIPETMTVTVGDTVSFGNENPAPITLTSPQATTGSGPIVPGQLWPWIAPRQGTFRFEQLQSNKKAVIIVREKPIVGQVQVAAIGKGAPVVFGTRLTLSGTSTAPGTVTIGKLAEGTREWKDLAILTPVAGKFSIGIVADIGAEYRAQANGGKTTSNVQKLLVKPKFTLTSTRKKVTAGRKVTLTVKVTPPAAGISVDVDRWDAKRKRWRQVARKSVNTATGLVKVVWAVPKGTTRLRADLQRAKRGFTRTTTPVLSVSGT